MVCEWVWQARQRAIGPEVKHVVKEPAEGQCCRRTGWGASWSIWGWLSGKACNMQDHGDHKKESGFYSESHGEISKKGTNWDQCKILRHCGEKTRRKADAADQGFAAMDSWHSGLADSVWVALLYLLAASLASTHQAEVESSSPPVTFQVVTLTVSADISASPSGDAVFLSCEPLRSPEGMKTWRGVMEWR